VYYYNSPIGTIKLFCTQEFLLEIQFVEQLEEQAIKTTGERVVESSYMEKEKIYKTKDIIPALKYYGSSFDKIKTKYPERAKALMLGYRAYKSGISEEQIRPHVQKRVTDKDMINLLNYKEIKSIRSWSVSSQLKKEDKKLEYLRIWCMRLGSIALLGKLSQKDIIKIATDTEELDYSVPKEF